jgi:uncharacterized protein YbjT (DUF2867 family)
MLDLSFVRDNLSVVEEKLRLRGMDPAQVLKDFHLVDTQRRQAITEAETMKARRNRASEDIAKLKKSGQDASAQIAETKELREQIVRASPLDWIIVRPAMLTNAERTGKYRAGFPPTDHSITRKISRADVADFMLKQATANTYLRQTPGISY